MPRIDIPIVIPKGPHVVSPVPANDLDFSRTAGDITNLNSFKATGKELLLVRNDDVAAQTFTIKSVADPFKRVQDITAYSLGISEEAAFWFGDIQGWRQPDGTVFIDPADADLKFSVMRIPD